MIFRGTFEHALDAKHRLTVPAKFRAALAGGVVLAFLPELEEGAARSLSIWPSADYDAFASASLEGMNPLAPRAQFLRKALYGNSFDLELDSANRLVIPQPAREFAGLEQGRGRIRAPASRFRSGIARRSRTTTRASCPVSPRSRRALTTLIDMTTPHVPVLAGELIELLDPAPGAIAVDCTVGGAGHARLVAERIGARGTLIGIDRDPLAEERFAELAAEVACETRFIRADFVSGLAQLRDEGVVADLVYMDLGMSSMQVDTWERGFSYSYEAPLDMRMDPSQELTAAEIVNTWEERRLARLLRDYGEERFAGPIARAITHARARAELETTQDLVDVIKAAVPMPAQFAGGHPAKRTFQALRIAVNDELTQIDEACRWHGSCSRQAAVWRRSRSIRSRTGASSASCREGARLHLPAGFPDLRLRPRAGGRAPEPPRDRTNAG